MLQNINEEASAFTSEEQTQQARDKLKTEREDIGQLFNACL